jgi:hypothetical protein
MTTDLGFIDPTASESRVQLARAPRPADLAGKVVGLLDNTKEQADIILETVAEELRRRYGVARVIIRRKDYFSRPAPAAMIDEMAREVQVAAAALGG